MKHVPFKQRKKDAEFAVTSLFADTSVSRASTREALVEIKELITELIAGLDDEANGVKDESQI